MKYFTIKELTKSATATVKRIDNTPTPQALANLTALVDNVLDPLREAWGRPIYVNSGYRCPALNKAVGGATTSEHMTGQAADISAANPADNAKLFALARKLTFNQLIWENGPDAYPDWIHISFSTKGNRGEKLRYKNGKYYPIP